MKSSTGIGLPSAPLPPIQPYATRTGTRRNLDALAQAGWRLLMTAGMKRRAAPPLPYAVDNGAWGAYQSGTPWDPGVFLDFWQHYGPGADWVVVPDIVQGGYASLRLSEQWLPQLSGLRLIPVQDGMRPCDLAPLVGPEVGIFMGGSTPWKLAKMRLWGHWARERGVYFHVGRVNSARRIALCQDAFAHSFDGTSATRYAVTLPGLDRARRQLHLWRDGSP